MNRGFKVVAEGMGARSLEIKCKREFDNVILNWILKETNRIITCNFKGNTDENLKVSFNDRFEWYLECGNQTFLKILW